MAVVPGFKHDVFISYAHFDNESDTQDIRWVSRFQADLKTALRQRLGAEPDIFFDSRNLQAHDELTILTDNAQKSAIFLAVFSPSYVKRQWTIKELEAFDQVASDRNRIVTVELLPIKEADYPPRFRQLKHAPFWWKDEREEDIAFKVTPKSNGDKYDRRLQTLAHQIEELMLELQAANRATQPHAPERLEIPVAAPPPEGPPGLSGKTVLLAQVTNDLYDERDQVLSYLKQYGVKVLPEGDYLQGGADFAKAVKADVERADYFVQMLGPYRSNRPSDLKDDPANPESKSYAQFQYDTAKLRGLPILQWRRADLDLASINHWDKPLLEGASVLAMGLQEFMKEIKKTIERDVTAAEHKVAPKTNFLFINADSSDQELTDRLLAVFENRRDWMAAGPLLEGTADEITKDLDANLTECGALMLVYGHASVPWVRAQLRRYSKIERLRDEPPRFKGILFAPPNEKAEIAWSGGFTKIECPSGLTGNDIERIMAELRR
jgi:hypothetical protein